MRICGAEEAAALVPDGATVLVEGSGGGVNEPTAILAALEQRFLDVQRPRDLTVVHISGIGDGQGGGIDRFAHPGMTRRVIGGHWGWSQRMQLLAAENRIEAYCLPQGTLSHLMRDIAAGRPGAVSAVGLGTFVDPRHGGGRLNAAARDDLVELVSLAGREWLFTRAFPVDVAIIRGTAADADGNLVMDGEGLFGETLAVAQAARNSGGIVLAQARHLAAPGSLDPRRVQVPGILIDALVIDPGQRLSFATADDPYLTGRLRAPAAARPAMPMSVRKVIARRAALELRRGDVINLGYGMPDGVAAVLAEEGIPDAVTLTVEQGHVGGIPAGGSDFGMCVNPGATLDAGQQFDWYDGGGLDVAVLSFAQLDCDGDVNVSRFGDRMPGVGGFINISQGARRLVFVGTFVAGRSPYRLDGGAIGLPADGIPKLVKKVEQISFAAARALETGQDVHYVTERAVFLLTAEGPELTEIAPGLDVDRDVLRHMDFTPRVSDRLAVMDERIFRDEPMKLALPAAPGSLHVRGTSHDQ